MPLDKMSKDYIILKKTVFMEGKGQGIEVKRAIAWVIYNRCRRNSTRWGRSIAQAQFTGQFDCWKSVAKVREMENATSAHRHDFDGLDSWLPSVFDGVDPTVRIGGAEHYYNAEREPPRDYRHRMRIEDFDFYRK